MAEEQFNVATADGVMDCYLYSPTDGGAWPLVLFYMDAFAIRAALAGMARRLASRGYTVVIPNLYYRLGKFPPFDAKAVAAGGAERDRFRSMIASISDTTVMA